MTKLTKTSVVVNVMSANADKPMAVVLPLINAALESELGIPFKEGYAREWYVWVVQKKLAPGVIERKARPIKDSSTKEVPAKKLLKEVGVKLEKPKKNRFTGNVKTTAPKTEDEVSRIKAANLARMKEITERNKVIRAQYNGNIARGADAPFDPEDFTPESARAELETADGLESFSAPRFLSKDAVKALV